MSVVHAIVGAPTPDGATFVAKVDGGGPVRVAVATNASMTSPTFTSSQAVDGQGVAKVAITGLSPATQHWWQVEDNGALDTAVTGRFRTAPVTGLAASFTFAAAGDGGAGSSGFVTDRVSNHPVYDEVRAADPEFFIHMGDTHYRDIGSGVHSPAPFDEADYRDAFDDMLTYNGVEGTAARQQHLYRECPLVPTWDNHDFGFTTVSNVDSDGNLPHRAAARTVFRERMPHYPMPAGSGDNPIYYSFDWGRVLFVVLDVRSERSPNSDPDGPSKTMLGAAQLAWLDNLLATSTAKALCLISAGQWLTVPTESDTWAAYETERAQVVAMLDDHGWLSRMWMLTASKHALGLDSGTGNINGGFPVGLFAALDAGSADDEPQQGLYDQGVTQPGPGQYGTVQVTDLGSAISVKLTGWHYQTGLWGEIQFGINVPTPATAASGALTRTIAGSHTPLIEARLVTGHPTGDDPDGVEIEVTDGDVIYDGTAEIRATMNLGVLGINERNGLPTFPRLSSDPLSPVRGAEVFLRYGLDLGGGGILWTPLGYFRYHEADQPTVPYGGIVLAGRDRMTSIIKGELLAARTYDEERTLGSVADDLILDIFPTAVIVWDDTSDQDQLGRVLVAEQSRYQALKEIADSRGKLFYVDDEGVFRFETAPDDAVPVWDVRAGHDGVLLTSSRRITSEDIYNAVVAIGVAADDQPPQRAVAIDNNPASPTYFHGEFGQVPRRYESPLLLTANQVAVAAISILRRSIGASFQLEFGSAVNPTLRPWHPVRHQGRDGNRDVVVMQRVTVPLGKRPMTGTARSQVLATTVGSIL